MGRGAEERPTQLRAIQTRRQRMFKSYGWALGLLLAAASVAQAELAHVKKCGELRVVMSGEYPPFSQPGIGGTLTGFAVDVGREIGRRLGAR